MQPISNIKQMVVLLQTIPPEHWPVRSIPISPEIWDIVQQTAQDTNVSAATVINVFLARAIVGIDNDET